ncbi:unnamed protein product [Blepharisma stoltei]|uniref:Uncharacterized protein n=1 Tax=Blepharisma stoltei TaxID=1481888 RepID=A0AAU9KC19_9CILI|nr:unnamed protein product [Blepharisma stoltei]
MSIFDEYEEIEFEEKNSEFLKTEIKQNASKLAPKILKIPSLPIIPPDKNAYDYENLLNQVSPRLFKQSFMTEITKGKPKTISKAKTKEIVDRLYNERNLNPRKIVEKGLRKQFSKTKWTSFSPLRSQSPKPLVGGISPIHENPESSLKTFSDASSIKKRFDYLSEFEAEFPIFEGKSKSKQPGSKPAYLRLYEDSIWKRKSKLYQCNSSARILTK